MSFARIVLDIPTRTLDRAYVYRIAEKDEHVAQIGCAVVVPFGSRSALGFIIDIFSEPAADVDIQSLKYVEAVVSQSYFDALAVEVINYIANYYIASLASVVHLFTPVGRRPKLVKNNDGVWELSLPAKRRQRQGLLRKATPDYECKKLVSLSDKQQEVFSIICEAYEAKSPEAIVVDGVTGSGKTEIYMHAIQRVLNDGKNALVLIPEISLTTQMEERYRAYFGDDIALMHSAMTTSARYDEWIRIKRGEAHVVIGPRSALFAPLENIGIIIIDEEHEFTYKQSSEPRYHARDVAWFMTQQRKSVLVLGSATPSLESLYLCDHHPRWKKVEITERINELPLPHISVVDMAQEFTEGHKSMFSRELSSALIDTIRAGCHSILFLNQRGFARFVLCRDCGFVPTCPTCSVSLTYHEDIHKLLCHHCGYEEALSPACPQCASPFLKKFGTGTQRVESQLKALLKDMPVDIIRMDADTTKKRGAHAKLLKQFASSKASILVGTQMIAKGLDFDDVALVGVIDADTQLKLPDFRANEKTFSLIEQVAGRAGRKDISGRVIVQTYSPESYSIDLAARYDKKNFLNKENQSRKLLEYPPFVRLINIIIWGKDNNQVKTCAYDLYEQLYELFSHEMKMYEASPCALSKLNNNFRWHILVKAQLDEDASSKISSLVRRWKYPRSVSLGIDVDPISLM
ncbi:MAG: primosomal protein N' [Eggerthellaceae bacterium]|nr:primosomal protein N' [Eggerthellaceae bacterium]